MSWTRLDEMPDCALCDVALLPRASSAEILGTGYWCPNGHGDVILATAKLSGGGGRLSGGQRLPGRGVAPLRPRAARLTWSGRVNRDGSLTWQVSGTGEPQEIGVVAKAMAQLTLAAERLRERLTGADRWVLSAEGAARFVTRYGEARELLVMKSHSGAACAACGGNIAPGSLAHRATRAGGEGRNPWTAARFCKACVDAAGQRPALALVSAAPATPTDGTGT